MITTEVVWEYDTAVWWQRLERVGAGFRLSRTYRDAGPWPEAADALGAVEGPAAVPVRPAEGGEGRYVFELIGGDQLAGQLWPVTASVLLADVAAFRRLGAMLARLHQVTPPPHLPVSSPHLRRLRTYLDDPAPRADEALRTLQPATVHALREVLDALPRARAPVLCHGGFSVGSVLTDPGHRLLEVVSGPELCLGPRELDLGWAIGELSEYELAAARTGPATGLFSRAATALRAGYSEEARAPIDQSLLDGVVAARVALHRLDYVTTTGQPEQTTISAFIDWLTVRWRKNQHEGETT